ncbi:MAG: hypothetical protein A2Z96_00995 [Spirochaetes bacterium GWB1_48_6]|nr:MAG: hypothetical protein A2Z96_00995 [Spirochaetes bacterium GWB1_48_6]
MIIFVDADACPVAVKEILYKASSRWGMKLIFVANQKMWIPSSPLISQIVVSSGADVADDHIVSMVEPGDLVISADIPLADRVIKKSGIVLDPRGVFLTADNIGPRLALRDLMDGLRSEGMVTGGPGAFGPKEKQAFANHLDRILARAQKAQNQ